MCSLMANPDKREQLDAPAGRGNAEVTAQGLSVAPLEIPLGLGFRVQVAAEGFRV